MQGGIALEWLVALVAPGGPPSLARPPGPHLRGQSLASRVPCRHSGGPRSPIRSHS